MTPAQAYRAALEAAAERVWIFSAGGKYSDDREAGLLNHLVAAIRALPVPEDYTNWVREAEQRMRYGGSEQTKE